jgi:PD-(D/E)XK nuclease superfamily
LRYLGRSSLRQSHEVKVITLGLLVLRQGGAGRLRRPINTSAIICLPRRKTRIFAQIRKMMHAEHADNSELNELSGRVIGRAFTVLNTLGTGFLERVFENALAYAVRVADLSAVQQYGAEMH